jgi:uncharacterized protein with HEPN domain
MRLDDATRIRHMIEAAEICKCFVVGRDRRDLDDDIMLRFALVRAIEIIGEAASKMRPETRVAAPSIPWAAIVGMRNRLIHAYFDVDNDVLRKSATEEIPRLAVLLQELPG